MIKNTDKEECDCHDCGALEGEIHKFGCDMERCPKCGYQLIGCDCLDNIKTERQLLSFFKKNGGRVPFIYYPWVCARCGEVNPDMFLVPDEEWKKYIEIDERNKILCKECYEEIKTLIDSNN